MLKSAYGLVAQLVEHCVRNAGVKGSSPSGSTKINILPLAGDMFIFMQLVNLNPVNARAFTKEHAATNSPTFHFRACSGVQKSLRVHQKRDCRGNLFFIQDDRLGMSSPHKVRCISSSSLCELVYHPASVYTYCRLDDIQSFTLMIYTPTA